MNNLILVEKVKNDFNQNNYPPDSQYIALTPQADYFLSKLKLNHKTADDYYDILDLNLIGDENFKRTDDFVKSAGDFIFSEFKFLKEKKINPFLFHFDCLKILFDAVIARIFIINRILEKESPQKIFYEENFKEILNENLFLYKEEFLFSQIIKFLLFPEQFEYKFKEIREFIYSKSILSLIKQNVLDFINYYSKWRNLRKGKINVLIGNLNYDLIPFAKHILKKNKEINFYLIKENNVICLNDFRFKLKIENDQSILEIKNEILSKFNRKFGNNKVFEFNQINFYPLIRNKINYFLKLLPKQIKEYYKYEKILEEINPNLFLTSAGMINFHFGIPFLACKNKNIPSVLIQHGSYGININPKMLITDFWQNDYLLVWGKGVKDYFENKKLGETRIIETGSPNLEKLYFQHKNFKNYKIKKRLKVIYVITDYRQNTAYYPGGQYEDLKYFKLHKEVLDIFKRYPQYDYIFKLPLNNLVSPFYDVPLKEYIDSLSIKDLKLINKPFIKILNQADLIIIDFPSTTLLQASCTDKPIIVFLCFPDILINENAVPLLEKRAICCKFEEDFLENIRKYLENGNFKKIKPNIEFLEKFCFHKSEGKSLERMEKFILQFKKEEKIIV